MPRVVEILNIADYQLNIDLDMFLQDVFYYFKNYPKSRNDRVVINDRNFIIGTPVYENNQLVTCPQCRQGLLFMHDSNNQIECTAQESCNFLIPQKNNIDNLI